MIHASHCKGEVAGFHTLSIHSVARKDVTDGWSVRNSPAQIPAVLLGMLGVDEKYKGIGLGASLLKAAIETAPKVAALGSAHAPVVDLTDDHASGFSPHFGFTELPGTSRMALKL